MASEVDIANLALGYLGDAATVVSLTPPDGSAQAQHCARFYPIARNSMLEMATWSFATKRISLAQVDNPSTTWQYAYAMPAGVINVISVLPADATDDYSATFTSPTSTPFANQFQPENDLLGASYTPQTYTIEIDGTGKQIILTNTPNAVLRYTIIPDAAQFSPLFAVALSWYLASFLAGPLLKGDAGAAQSERCLKIFQIWEGQAEASDATQRKVNPQQIPPWIGGR